jgi:CDP-glucose 4,6-dehydratase
VESFFPKQGPVRVGIGRAGNVIGGGDWAVDRIIPDCVRAWGKGQSITLRNANATRPWQHVLEPLSGYLNLAAALHQDPELHGEPFNFGPSSHQNQSVQKLVEMMSSYWAEVRWEEASQSENGPYESKLLKLNCDKAKDLLNWQAALSLPDTVRMTAEWYQTYYREPNKIREMTLSQISDYESIARKQGLTWAQ